MINKISLYFFTSISLAACGIYSFTGASISADIETVSVDYFQNNASMVQPTLSNIMTERLKDQFISQTNLSLTDAIGDLQFKGEITGYVVKPIAIQANETAAQNRLTISVKVTFINNLDENQNYSQSFSHYADFDSSQDLSSIETELIDQIVVVLSENIFNKAVANW